MTRCQHCGAENVDDARFCGACGQAVSATEPASRAGGATGGGAPAPDLVGREIAGRYRILAKLGEGGMGAVYRGEQISLKRRCAVKLLRPELSGDAGLVRRFNAEAELAAKLSHPNTVNIIDFGQDADGTLFIAMEFVEGRSLRQVLAADGPLPVRRALHILAQVCASIADAHGHGIVHRDLKPDNVMLSDRGRDKDVVRVLDFGIAKLRDEQNKTQAMNPMTQAGDMVGTPQYMAPEQIRGETVDARTDVYAIGTILYEMVTGRLPFEGPSLMAILSKHLLETPEPPTRRRPDLQIPPSLDGLIMQMLAKDPASRPPSMDAVSERIAQVAAEVGAPSAVMPASWAPPPGTGVMRPPGVPATHPGMRSPLPGAAIAPTAPSGPPPYMPPPYTPPPYTPPGGPSPYVAPMQPYPMMPPPAPMPASTSRGIPVWVWVLVGLVAVVVVGGVIAAGVIAANKQEREEEARTGAPDAAVTAKLDGEVAAMDAYEVVLPPGFMDVTASIPDVPPGGTTRAYMGAIDGKNTGIVMFSGPEDLSELPADQLEDGCDDIARQYLQGSMVLSGPVTGKGSQRFRCTIEAAGQRWEGAIYTSAAGILALFIGAEPGDFEQLGKARDELFDRRVRERSP